MQPGDRFRIFRGLGLAVAALLLVSGAVFATGTPREIGANPEVRAVYLGRAGHA